MLFGEKLKELRTKKGISQEKFGAIVGVSSRAIRSYELGQGMPKSMDTVKNIANYFNVTVDYLMDSEDKSLVEPGFSSDAEKILMETRALFAGGKLDDEDKNAFFLTLSEIYFNDKKGSSNSNK